MDAEAAGFSAFEADGHTVTTLVQVHEHGFLSEFYGL